MKLYTLLLFSILTVFTSCNGQNRKTVDINSERTNESNIGETVSELSKSIWIVFQATNGDYWFGSNGQGSKIN